jgi:quinoprotein glucose dehydrogenase
MRSDGLFTPPSLRGTIHYPGVAGGTNWGSVAFDPERELVIMNTSRVAFGITLFKRDEYDWNGEYGDVERGRQEGTPYVLHREALLSPLGLPITPPPWGTLTAISTVTGKQVWESVLGTTRDLAPVPIAAKWGTPNMGGPIVTRSGVTFISATMDYYLRAFDTATGKQLWKGRLPAGGQATPMTYRVRPDGRQYVVICAGGHGKMGTKLGDYVIAFALPDESD